MLGGQDEDLEAAGLGVGEGLAEELAAVQVAGRRGVVEFGGAAGDKSDLAAGRRQGDRLEVVEEVVLPHEAVDFEGGALAGGHGLDSLGGFSGWQPSQPSEYTQCVHRASESLM
jgi:hypothetical protein